MAKEHCECLQKVQHFAAKSGVCKIVIQYDEKKIFIKIKCRTRTRCQQVTRARKVRGTIETNGNGRKTINCTKNCTSHNGPAHTAIAHNCWKWNGAPHRYNDKTKLLCLSRAHVIFSHTETQLWSSLNFLNFYPNAHKRTPNAQHAFLQKKNTNSVSFVRINSQFHYEGWSSQEIKGWMIIFYFLHIFLLARKSIQGQCERYVWMEILIEKAFENDWKLLKITKMVFQHWFAPCSRSI